MDFKTKRLIINSVFVTLWVCLTIFISFNYGFKKIDLFVFRVFISLIFSGLMLAPLNILTMRMFIGKTHYLHEQSEWNNLPFIRFSFQILIFFHIKIISETISGILIFQPIVTFYDFLFSDLIILLFVYLTKKLYNFTFPPLDNKDQVLELISEEYRFGGDPVFKIASKSLKSDREVVLAAVKHDGEALRYASESFKSDREIVLAAIIQNTDALIYASNFLKSDREFVLAAVKGNGETLKYVTKYLTSDREVVLAAVNQNPKALKYASESLNSDRELVLTVVKQEGNALQYAANSLKSDLQIVAEAIRQNPEALQFASKYFKEQGIESILVQQKIYDSKDVILNIIDFEKTTKNMANWYNKQTQKDNDKT